MLNLLEHVSSKNKFVAYKTKVCSIGCCITSTNLLQRIRLIEVCFAGKNES